jgi:hypothetical protein
MDRQFPRKYFVSATNKRRDFANAVPPSNQALILCRLQMTTPLSFNLFSEYHLPVFIRAAEGFFLFLILNEHGNHLI